MAAARVPSAELSRVVETLEMIAPRWSVWVLMTLAADEQPLRYSDVRSRLPWLGDAQLTSRLRGLSEAGLVERTAVTYRHVSYGLTDRGRALLPTLHALAAYGDQHLDKRLVDTTVTKDGKTTVVRLPERIPAAQNAEDTLALITYKHATTLLWTLRERGPSTLSTLRKVTMPDLTAGAVHSPANRLLEDRLIARTASGGLEKAGREQVCLTDAARALAPVYQAVAAWASGRPQSDTDDHPLWGTVQLPAAARSGQWAAHQARNSTRSTTAVAQPAGPMPVKAWRPAELFSSAASGPCR
ncbi:winged helix-turn-helix transcriptional regulator [Streptomyces sp. NPDC048718]|uniref:winged helix-turn-helix transcriptional regulator n=1 Tax=Streptomyces sp. NPDC048718 TaxID=3365587 RepID=UPI0037145D18